MATKSRFSATDVKAMVRDLRSLLLGQRVANVYNVTDKTYLFKFAIPGSSEKIMLLLESGVRFHTTKYARDKNDMPSPFAMKLRKFIRTKRLEDIRQIGSDRVVDFKFGSGDSVCHIILELYASGNIVLTDGAYEIQALLRSHQFDDDVAVKMHEIYPIAFTTSLDTMSLNSSSDQPQSILEMSEPQFIAWAQQRDRLHDEAQSQDLQQSLEQKDANGNGKKSGGGNKKNKAKKMTMRQLLLCKESGIASFGPEIIDHCLLAVQLSPSTKVADTFGDSVEQQSTIASLLRELQQGANLLSLLNTPGQPGYILIRQKKLTNDQTNKNKLKNKVLAEDQSEQQQAQAQQLTEFYDFIPRRFLQHESDQFVEYPSFDQTVDEYFCKIEEQKLQQQASAAEESAKKKVNKVKAEMENQLKGFVMQQQKMEMAATLVEIYAEDIDKACLVINSALAAGVSWDDLEAMVVNETAAGNPIASLISRLLLPKNHVILKLPNLNDSESDSDSDSDEDEDEDEDEEQREREDANSNKRKQQTNKSKKTKTLMKKTSSRNHYVEVEIDLSLSAFANASQLYSNKKVAKGKEMKTAQASEKAIEAVEKQTFKQLEAQRLKRNLQAVRKVHWFEKFNWFITSEGYLVLSGRDAQQNEQLVKKYLRSGDAYVHADMHGASSCIVRAKLSEHDSKPLPLSPFALQEAGTMTICRSGAWNVKVVMSAWWVQASQVSKTAPTGEYLTTGSFMIYGRKNFLPPASLEMGFGIMFRLDDSSVSRHLNDRKDKLVEFADDNSDSSSMSMISDLSERYSIDMTTTSSVAAALPSSATGRPTLPSTLDRTRGAGAGAGLADTKKAARASRKAQKTTNQNEEGSKSMSLEQPLEPEQDQEDDQGEGEGEEKEAPPMQEVAEESSLSKGNKASQGKKKGKDNNSSAQSKKGSAAAPVGPAAAPDPDAGFKKKKAPNKKKARRYANQDEEDLELAMQALGHRRPGGGVSTLTEKQEEESQLKKSKEKQLKQEKAGVHLLKEDWSKSLDLLTPEVREAIENLVASGQMKSGELDSFEISTLAAFNSQQGLEILRLFAEDGNLSRIKNKSGFLAGIMRRYSSAATTEATPAPAVGDKDLEEDSPSAAAAADVASTQVQGDGDISRRERKKLEQQEIQAILEDEGILDEMEGKQADELEKLTGNPLPEDLLLYAVPVCGPYKSLQSMKYVVKLTPGTGKKGKTAKNAIEVFSNTKDCSPLEKSLMKGLTDPEMVAIMIGDVKLSVPGLYSTLKNKKNEKKKSSKEKA